MARCRAARALSLAALLVATTLAALAPGAGAASASEESRLPAALVGSSAVYVDGKSYVFGGRLVDGTYTDAIYAYDHATGGVKQVARLPAEGADHGGRQSGAAALLNGKIYYFGGAVLSGADVNGDGVTESVPRSVSQVVEFDPSTNAVRVVTNMPTPAWGLSASAMGGKVYLFGGFLFDLARAQEIKRLDVVQEFDGSRVRTLTKLPYPLQDAASTPLAGRIYLFGGLGDHDAQDNPCPTYDYQNPETGESEQKQPSACLTDAILSYNPSTGVATPIAKLPYRAQFLNAGVVNSKAYVAGGALPGPTATGSIVEFDPSTASPVRVLSPTLPRAVYGAPATSDGSIITVFGGRVGGYQDLSDVIVAFDPRPTPPWAPRSLTAAAGSGGITLSWEPPAYDGGSPVTVYRVYRATPDGDERLLANVTGVLEHVDAAAQPGIQYAYRVTAVSAAGESETSARVDKAADVTVPGAVDSLEVFTANRELVLRWLPPAGDGGSAIVGYRIYRDGDAKPHASVVSGVTEWRDLELENGRTYTYALAAYNSKGEGPRSAPQSGTPAPVPDPPVDVAVESTPGGGVRVSWNDPLVGATDGFRLYRGTEPKHLVEIANQTERVYVDETVEQGRTYYYTITAYNDQGESPPTTLASISLVTPPSAPAQLIVSPGQGEVRLTWQQPVDVGGADPAKVQYYIKRDGQIYKTDLAGTTFLDRPLQPGRTFRYEVGALNPLMGPTTEAKSATVKEIINEAPRPVLAALPPIAKAGESIEFDASQSVDPDGSILTYTFEFGDGTPTVTTDKPSVEHAYVLNGTYYPSVTVKDNLHQQSEPMIIQVVIGQTSGPLDDTQTGLGTIPGRDDGAGTPAVQDRPGTKTPTPGPGLALVALALVGGALVAQRRRRG